MVFRKFVVLTLLALAQPAWAVSPSFRADVDKATSKLQPMMLMDGIAAPDRPKAAAIVEGLIKKYPQEPGAYHLAAMIYMASGLGDKAIANADIACKLDSKECGTGNGYVKEIEGSFSWCMDVPTRERDCVMTHNSSQTLTIILKDKYLTNLGDDQKYIGKIESLAGKTVKLKITWAAKNSGLKKGQSKVFPLAQVMKLRKVSPQAEQAGWH